MSATAPARRMRSASVAVVCCSVLVLLLPTLLATLSLGEPATAGELARLERILTGRPPAEQIDTGVSRWFHTAVIAGSRWPEASTEQQALVVRARVAQVLGIAGIALLTYLVVLLGRGRLSALLACFALALLPPIATSGHVLRVETPATVLALLSLLLLQVACSATPRMRVRRPRRQALIGGMLMFWSAFAAALAIEALPSSPLPLLLPGLVLVIGSVQHGVRGVRCLRRRSLIGTPIRALNRRMLPWTATALITPALALWVQNGSLTVSVDKLAQTSVASSLLPSSGVGYWLVGALLWGGLLVGSVRIGRTLNRGGRIGADLLLFVFAAPAVVAFAAGDGRHDPLVLAPGIAILIGEGAQVMLVAASGLLPRAPTPAIRPRGR